MRLFVALVPPEEVRRRLEAEGRALRGLCGGGRMVPRENLHLTLAFLGETDRRRAAERAMDRAAGAPFSLATAFSTAAKSSSGSGIFPFPVSPQAR